MATGNLGKVYRWPLLTKVTATITKIIFAPTEYSVWCMSDGDDGVLALGPFL